MSNLILLSHLRIENANAVAGLTWGFPAITHFLGYTHALSRKLVASHGLMLDGCAIICHDHQVHAHSSGRDFRFALTRNPLTREGKTAAFNEEGRMHLTVSLLLDCHGEIENGDYGKNDLSNHLAALCPGMKLAGGMITALKSVRIFSDPQTDAERRALLWRLMPGFALCDRSGWLAQQHQALLAAEPQATLLDAWLDFSALKMQAAEPEGQQPETGDAAPWHYLPKPQPGWLVPLMTGYQRISPLYPAGEVANARDATTPFAFSESVYGIGEWCGLHRIRTINEIIWRYHTTESGYYCRSGADIAQSLTEHHD